MITYFTDTCVASVNNPKNQYNCDQHQSPSNASDNHSYFRACFFCDENQDSIKFTCVVIWNGFTEKKFCHINSIFREGFLYGQVNISEETK